MSLIPDFSIAMAELRSLSGLYSDFPKALDHFTQTGLPLFVCEVDWTATNSAGDLLVTYKLTDQLHVSLTAVGARKRNMESVGVDHS
jgi:hypothetical protein